MEDENVFFSNVSVTEDDVIIGIDEAGRGPVVGYMVYSALVMPIDFKNEINFKDSKELSHAQRNSMFEMIEKKNLKYVYHCSHPNYISRMMMIEHVTLNEISMISVLKILREIQGKCSNVRAVYVDALGDCKIYKARLEEMFPYDFIIEEKADSKFQVVSGASIIAKIQRDRLISEFGEDLGSGYPSDPVTIAWLERNMNEVFGFPKGVRYSWATIKRMLGIRRSKPLKGILDGFYFDCT